MISNDNIFAQWTFVLILSRNRFLWGIYKNFGVILTPFCVFRLRIVYVNIHLVSYCKRYPHMYYSISCIYIQYIVCTVLKKRICKCVYIF